MSKALLRHRRLVLALLALALAGCGPTVPLNAGLREAGASIQFGTPAPEIVQPAPAPPTNANIVPNFPAPLEQPPVFSITAPVGLSLPCPDAAPGAVLQAPAPATPSVLPAPTSTPYTFRYFGTKKLDPGKADEQDFTLPTTGTRAVNSPVYWFTYTFGTYQLKYYEFTVTEHYNGMTTAITYDEYPNGYSGTGGPNVQGTQPAAGLYLVKMTVTDASGNTDTFQPAPSTGTGPSNSQPEPRGVELVPFPAQQGATVQSSGVDGANDEAMTVGPRFDASTNTTLQSGIRGHANVNACDKLLDSWEDVLYGQIQNARSSSQSETFTLILDVGTEYGGLSLSDHLIESGTDAVSGKPFTYDVTATIDEVPGTVPDTSARPGGAP